MENFFKEFYSHFYKDVNYLLLLCILAVKLQNNVSDHINCTFVNNQI